MRAHQEQKHNSSSQPQQPAANKIPTLKLESLSKPTLIRLVQILEETNHLDSLYKENIKKLVDILEKRVSHCQKKISKYKRRELLFFKEAGIEDITFPKVEEMSGSDNDDAILYMNI